MHEFLLTTIKKAVSIEEEDSIFLKSIFKKMILKKGDYFLKQNTINNKLGFVDTGLVRYFIYKNEEEITIDFSKEGEFISVYESFIQKSKSTQSIQAIEDSIILYINNEDLQNLYANIKNGNKLGRILIEKRFIELAKQLMSKYLDDAEKRYINFYETYPDLINRIPQYLISSFVGIKPESLSRIRNRIAKNKSIS